MTSMFDQYEQDSQKQRIVNINTIPPGMTTSGYIQMTSQEETPIFEKQKLSFNPLDRITHLAVSNDYLVLAMANNILFRMDLQNPERHEEITLTKNSTSSHLTNLFLDPLGQHLLLSYGPRGSEGSTELLYLPRKNSKLRPTTKFRNHEITAVAWNHTNDSDLRTGPILLGTSRGLIFETEITMDGDGIFQTSIEKYWQQVFDIGKGSNIPITGLEYHQVSKTERYFILVTTANRLYQFIGNANSDEKPLLQQIFNSYLNVQDSIKEEIKSSLKYSKLNFCYQQKGIPKTFALLTEPGIFWGELDPYGREDINNVVNINEIIEYPGTNNMSDSPQKPPIPSAFVITAFHALLLYSDNVKGISLLNKELIFEENYSEKLVNITKDPARGTIWVFTERTIYRYKVTREERNVWKIYCDKGQFDLAKKYCQDNPAHLDRVLVKEAEVLFDNGDYLKSAQRYANTQSSFEEICLKFLQRNQLNALKKFLEQKLDKLKTQDKTQITLIVLWVIELFLNQLGQLRNNGEQTSDKYSNLQKEFDAFLATNIVTECVRSNKQTVYDLMASHGDKHNLIKLTIVNKDFEQVIRQHIYKNDYREALEVLGSQSKRDLYYQFIPILMQEIPKQTVSALISQGRTLSPIKLLPALVGCDADEIHINETIRYLEFCVLSLGSTERAIHNYLLSLYVKHKPEKLKEYLATQGQDSSMIFYDVHYTLRLCLEKGLTEACVQLSALLGLWESAVDLALTVSIDLAKQTANMPDSDNELKKKLWLKIAKHVVSGKNDIQQAMEFLQQCDLIKIEDILPFFSDFDTIDHFKDAICTSLQEYNQHIQDLKEEMEEATKSAEMIRNEIQTFRNRCSTIGVDDTCAICNLTLIIRPFYYFPCTHKFHSDCLLAELRPLLGPANSNKLADLNRQLAMLSNTADNVSMGSASLSARDQVKADIDNIIASECLYCGEYMIRDIDAPFIDDREFETIVKDWA